MKKSNTELNISISNINSVVKGGYWTLRILVALLLLMFTRGKPQAEVPNGRWASVATYGGVGVRFTPPQRFEYYEGRFLFGEGVGASLRGGIQWEKEGWKVCPLAGIELSFLAPNHGKGERGESLLLFVGGEIHLVGSLTFQVDMGPALLRIREKKTKKEEWEYQNVLNAWINYYFGKRALKRGTHS